MAGSMKLLTLSCNECGAPLEVPESAKYVTCGYCGARLTVQRTASAVYTEVLEAIDQRTERLAQDLETLKLQNELAQLDRDWDRDREKYMVRGKNGSRTVPATASSVIGVVFVIAFGIFCIGVSVAGGVSVLVPLFGVLFIGFCIATLSMNIRKADAYANARSRYERRRRELVERIHGRKSPFADESS